MTALSNPLQTLRALVYDPPSLHTWQQIVQALDACPPPQRDLAIDYVADHTLDWPLAIPADMVPRERLRAELWPSPFELPSKGAWLQRLTNYSPASWRASPPERAWKLLRALDWPEDDDELAPRLRRARLTHLRTLMLRGWRDSFVQAFRELGLPQLDTLIIKTAKRIALRSLEKLGTSQPPRRLFLACPSMRGESRTLATAMSKHLRAERLEVLSLELGGSPPEQLSRFVHHAPNLRALRIGQCKLGRGKLGKFLARIDRARLTHLSLRGCGDADAMLTLSEDENFKGLKSLEIVGSVAPRSLEALCEAKHLEGLESLRLANTRLDDAAFLPLANATFSGSLKHLSLDRSLVSDGSVRTILSGCPSLIWFSARDARLESWSTALSGGEGLRVLDVGGASRFDEDAVVAFLNSKLLPELEAVLVSHWIFTDELQAAAKARDLTLIDRM